LFIISHSSLVVGVARWLLCWLERVWHYHYNILSREIDMWWLILSGHRANDANRSMHVDAISSTSSLSRHLCWMWLRLTT